MEFFKAKSNSGFWCFNAELKLNTKEYLGLRRLLTIFPVLFQNVTSVSQDMNILININRYIYLNRAINFSFFIVLFWTILFNLMHF